MTAAAGGPPAPDQGELVCKAWRLVALLATFAPSGAVEQIEGTAQALTGSPLSWASWERVSDLGFAAALVEAEALAGDLLNSAECKESRYREDWELSITRAMRTARRAWLTVARAKDGAFI